MANSVATISLADNRSQFAFGMGYMVIGTVSVSNANYVTGGIPMSFLGNPEVKATRTPLSVAIVGQGVSGSPIYDYNYVYGPDASSGLMRISTGGAELANGAAVPSGVLNDVITFVAIFRGME